MEVVDVCTQKYRPPYRSVCTTLPKGQNKKKYIQPPKVVSFAPKKIYQTPTTRFHTQSTYDQAFLNNNAYSTRSEAIRPQACINKSNARFEDGTTHKLAYQPVWDVVKTKPILPNSRKLIFGPFDSTTISRSDFIPKYAEKQEMVIPEGHIRSSKAPLEGHTTSGISYPDPGPYRPPESFKPRAQYFPPEQPTAQVTTQKLSYQPVPIGVREKYPWAEKKAYKRSADTIDDVTTYKENYIPIDRIVKEKPIMPSCDTNLLLGNREFSGVSCYNRDFIPRALDRAVIQLPRGNIALSDMKMTDQTTSKLSYPPIIAEKRLPMRPIHKMMTTGSMQLTTTHQRDFPAKTSDVRPDIILPSNNIRSSDKPFVGETTTAISYMNYGPHMPPVSFKPLREYQRSSNKIEDETINKLSYKPWHVTPPEEHPWAKKAPYQRPKVPLIGETTYKSTFAAPGYFIEECENQCQNEN